MMQHENPCEINGRVLEGPLKEAPPHEATFWVLFDHSARFGFCWDGSDKALRMLSEGRVFCTQEARDAMEAEVLRLMKGAA